MFLQIIDNLKWNLVRIYFIATNNI